MMLNQSQHTDSHDLKSKSDSEVRRGDQEFKLQKLQLKVLTGVSPRQARCSRLKQERRGRDDVWMQLLRAVPAAAA